MPELEKMGSPIPRADAEDKPRRFAIMRRAGGAFFSYIYSCPNCTALRSCRQYQCRCGQDLSPAYAPWG